MHNHKPIASRGLTSDDEALWAGLERIATRKEVGKGKALFQQGDLGRGLFLLCKGNVTVTMNSRVHKKLLYRTIGPGHILGLPAALSGAPYSLSAECATNCELAFIAAEEVVELLRRRGDLCLHAVRIMAQEVRQLRRKQASLLS